MKLMKMWIAVSIAAALVIPAAAPAQRSPEVALRAAMETETVKGDLKGAIEQYKKIADGKDRALAAKALIRMAECHQKLGDSESRTIYERIVKDYTDQKEAVAIAQAKLGGGSPQNSGVITRQVWTGPTVDAYGTVSHDGRIVSFTDWSTGDLAVHDFASGQDHRLTNKGSWEQSPAFALLSAISPDGKQVAYEWLTEFPDYFFEVRLLDLNGGKARVLVANTPGKEILPLDWSPDGKWLAVRVILAADQKQQIALVSTADGALRVLKSSDWPGGLKLAFSPDGKYLACDLGANDKREIHLLAVDGGSETPALAQPANDRVLGWSPDGKRLLFASDRTGLTGIWAQAIVDGKPQGAPELIKANVNPNPLGVTRSGALYYSVIASGRDVYVASVDLETGKLLSAPAPLAQAYFGLNDHPQWSRDGKYLAYLSKRDANSRNQQLDVVAIRSMDTGKVRELTPNLHMYPGNSFSQPVWAPDGGSLLVNGVDRQGRRGVYRIDGQNGNAIPVVQDDQGQGRQNVSAHAWSPDGKTVYISRADRKSKVEMLFARDMQSGQEREIVRRERLASVALSRDGRLLAMPAFDMSAQSGSLLVIPVGGGEPRELLRTSNSGPDSIGVFVTWSPDGKFVIFRKGPAAARETYRIPAEGGVAVKYGADWTVGPTSINPDGRQVAFPMGQHKIEIWAMENFLPATAAKK